MVAERSGRGLQHERTAERKKRCFPWRDLSRKYDLMRAPIGFLTVATLLCLSSTLACTPAPQTNDAFTFTTFDPGDGDGDTETGGDGDGDTGSGSCGDGVLDVGEECDFGESNSDGATCTTTCKVAECGDGLLLEGLEECDDGNNLNTDDCVLDCKLATCGDGFAHAGVEECDDGNDDETDGCASSCTPGVCGDGILQGGEQCDDGNDITTDACPACQLAFCGDGYMQAGVEFCDDGNLESNDACTAPFCEPASCGDGIIWAGMEECDDGNQEDGDQCPTSCTVAFCGDGFTLDDLEECDDGNDVDDDTCTNDCISNGIFYSGMFTQNQVDQNLCQTWTTFRTELQGFNNYAYVKMWGSNDPTGVECMGAAANTICQALSTGQAMNSIACNGRTWNIGNCGNGPELNAQGAGVCQCTNPGYVVRPCIGNSNWGGINSNTCGGPTQSMEVVCQ
jgi:cysteine-rich repeat protein